MKSFFKKLSFVLAAAMIITLIPAQAAKAEGTIKLALQSATSSADAISYDTLKVGEKQDYKFYGCLDWQTTGLGWVSSNEAVATVDKSGVVTAVAAGVAQISYEAKGYTTEAITLLVADEYDVNLAKQENKEVVTGFKFTAIGQEQDFCFVGAKGYSLNTHKCTWFSTNTAVATVDKVGNVTAVGEGNAQIVLTIVEKATNKVAFAVAPVAITVEVAKLEAAQTSYNTAKVTFNDEAAKDIKVYSVIDGERQVEYVESKDGVVTFYNELVNGREYVFVANGSEASFVASIAPVASFQLSTKSQIPDQINGKVYWQNDAAYVGQPTQVQISKFVDAAGIDVKRKNYTFEFEDVCDDIKSINYDGIIYIGEKGEVHNVTVTAIDNKTGDRVVSETITVVGQPLPSLTLKNGTAVAKVGTVGTSFDKSGSDFRLSIDDEAAYGIALSVKDIRENLYKFSAGSVRTGIQDDADKQLLRDLGQFVFESTDYDVLGVTDEGVLEARAEGHATILVYFEYVDDDLSQTQKVLLTSVPFTVIGHLVPTTVTLDYVNTNMFKNGSYVRLADAEGACNFNYAEIGYVVKDQLGRKMNPDNGLVVKATITNEDYLDWDYLGNGIYVIAEDIPDTANNTNQSITSNIRFTFTKWNVTKTASATIMVINIDDAKQSQVPGVAMCLEDDATGIGNTDNTYLGSDDKVTVGVHIVDVFYVGSAYVYGYDVLQSVNGVADLAAGLPYNRLFDYSRIKNLSKSADLEKFEKIGGAINAASAQAFYVELKLDGKAVNIENDARVALVDNAHDDNSRANARYLQVTIRAAFDALVTDLANGTIAALQADVDAAQEAYDDAKEDLADAKEALAADPADAGLQADVVAAQEAFDDAKEDLADAKAALAAGIAYDLDKDGDIDAYDHAMNDAKKLASIKNVKLEANVYDLYNTNTMEDSQVTTTWKKGLCSKYDNVGTVIYENNDEKNYAASIAINDLTYQGDIPAGIAGWKQWFSEHTDLSANVWIADRATAYKTGVAYAYDGAIGTQNSDPRHLYAFDVSTMTSNSKYIQAAGMYFLLYDSIGNGVKDVVTYIPYSIGKKVTQENYQYKTEDIGTDNEFPGIWAD